MSVKHLDNGARFWKPDEETTTENLADGYVLDSETVCHCCGKKGDECDNVRMANWTPEDGQWLKKWREMAEEMSLEMEGKHEQR